MLIVALPLWAGAAVIVTVRLAPLPPNTMPLAGTSVVFDELPPRLRASPSTSATVRFIVPLALAPTHWPPATSAIVGASFTAVMLMVKLCGALVAPSLLFSTTVILALPLGLA
jgi:hypothetical protein